MHDIPIKNVMASPVVTVSVSDSLRKVEEKFRQKGIRHLPVVDEQKRVVGLITQRDLYRIATPRLNEDGYCYDPDMLDGFILSRVMRENPLTMRPEDFLSKAVHYMAANKYGCIPIVDAERRIAGIITETDILKFAAKTFFNYPS